MASASAGQFSLFPSEVRDASGITRKRAPMTKEQGQALVEGSKAVPEEWKTAFVREVQRLARTGRQFTSEDVVSVVGVPAGANPNVVGARVSACAKMRIIRRCGFRKSKRPERRSAIVAVWVGMPSA